jgi:hypothetical protein
MKINIREYLKGQGGASIELPATIQFDDLFKFAGIDEEFDLDVQDLLARQRQIAVIWSTDDVWSVRSDLSEDQCWEVLKQVEHYHDANQGISWATLEIIAEELCPEPEASNNSTNE